MNDVQFKPTLSLGQIALNTEEIESQLSAKMEEYKAKQYEGIDKKEAKADLAYLRKLKKQIVDRDREVKQAFMRPYDDFRTCVSRIIALVDEPISFIDGWVKEVEEKRVLERKREVLDAYNSMVPEELTDYIPLECIYGAKWDNATTTIKTIKAEIEDVVRQTQSDISVISGMDSDATEQALNLYMGNRNLASAIKHVTDYEAKKREILKRQEEQLQQAAEKAKQDEIDRIRREERERIQEEARIKETAKKEAVEAFKDIDEAAAAPLSTAESLRVLYTVVATPEEIQEIEMALTSLGVYFERKDV